MKITHRGMEYEMSFVHAIGLELHRAWFPLRRLLRAGKRALHRLSSWASTLLLFIPICLLVLAGLTYSGVLNIGDAVTEFASILLGSFLLLAIKEIRDSESDRGGILRQQWALYSRWKNALTRSLLHVARCVGCEIKDWEILNSTDCLDKAIASIRFLRAQNGEWERGKMDEELFDISETIREMAEQARVIGFIDWNPSAASRWEFDNLSYQINSISEAHLWGPDAKEQVRSLAYALLCLLALVRRPWRYRNDIARRELIDRYVERYGVSYR